MEPKDRAEYRILKSLVQAVMTISVMKLLWISIS